MKKIPSTKILKSQITKHKYQTNHNDQNSKSQMFGSLKNWDLGFICYLMLETWNFVFCHLAFKRLHFTYG